MTLKYLSQVIAAEKDDKAKAAQSISNAENRFGKSNLFRPVKLQDLPEAA